MVHQQTETIWLTVPEAAARVQCGAKLIYRAAKAGKLRAAKIGGRGDLRFKPEWIDAWAESCAAPVEIIRSR